MDKNREIALKVLYEINNNKAYSNITLNKYIKGESKGDFIRELVYGCLENQLYLDSLIENLLDNGGNKLKLMEKIILRMGIYQMKFMDKVPAYAAINESVELAKKYTKGKASLVNACLNRFNREAYDPLMDLDFNKLNKKEKCQYLSLKYSFEMWIIKLWLKEFDNDFEKLQALLKASNEKAELAIRTNSLKISREELLEKLENQGFTASPSQMNHNSIMVNGSNLVNTELFQEGFFSIQDEASTFAANLLDAKPGDKVLDLCAAPGGKTCAVAENMNNSGKLIACDIYEHKLDLIKNSAHRLGIDIIETMKADGCEFKDEWKGKFDRVLCDVPCSGLGVIRRKPEIKLKEYEDLNPLYEIQRKILNNGSKYVKQGGTLLYSTCTINSFENTIQVESFLKEHEDFELEYMKQFIPGIHSCDGFFVAKLIRRA
ncbi:MAG: 16S rRNA (cytosine(967)-C(5))-methyltransferase RsmB [Clostridia bacterium]|nr:16S rRNA (cytosine(967)-C(5))-methyltransferase RsmB [Clostridia bacterium]